MSRELLPSRRHSWAQKVKIDGQTFYVTFGEYPDGRLGEIWIDAKKEGTFARGVLGALARSSSIALQSGITARELVYSLKGLHFPPFGNIMSEMTSVKSAKSLMDYIAQEIEATYVNSKDVDERDMEGGKTDPTHYNMTPYLESKTNVPYVYEEKPVPKVDSRKHSGW